jgi:hypothetical protein
MPHLKSSPDPSPWRRSDPADIDDKEEASHAAQRGPPAIGRDHQLIAAIGGCPDIEPPVNLAVSAQRHHGLPGLFGPDHQQHINRGEGISGLQRQPVSPGDPECIPGDRGENRQDGTSSRHSPVTRISMESILAVAGETGFILRRIDASG